MDNRITISELKTRNKEKEHFCSNLISQYRRKREKKINQHKHAKSINKEKVFLKHN